MGSFGAFGGFRGAFAGAVEWGGWRLASYKQAVCTRFGRTVKCLWSVLTCRQGKNREAGSPGHLGQSAAEVMVGFQNKLLQILHQSSIFIYGLSNVCVCIYFLMDAIIIQHILIAC